VADDFRNRPLLVSGYIATRKGDAERGPQVRLTTGDARDRLLEEGELGVGVRPAPAGARRRGV
jgi:hypothetical protein